MSGPALLDWASLQAYTVPPAGAEFDTSFLDCVAFDYNVVAFAGGTTPAITFAFDRRGKDGIWYPVWTTAAINAAAQGSVDIGRFSATYAAGTVTMQHAVLTHRGRTRIAVTGAPASVTFSYSVVGRG